MTVALLTSQQPDEALALATGWAQEGAAVTVVLLDTATAVLRPGHDTYGEVAAAHAAGVRVWAHDTAVAERAIPAHDATRSVDLDEVAALIGDDVTVQWW